MLVMDEEHRFRLAFRARAIRKEHMGLWMKMKSLIRQSHRRCVRSVQLGVTPTVTALESELGSQK